MAKVRRRRPTKRQKSAEGVPPNSNQIIKSRMPGNPADFKKGYIF